MQRQLAKGLIAPVLVALAAASATPADAAQARWIYRLLNEIHNQAFTVDAQTQATFSNCGDADDVFDELADLDRLLHRFENQLAEPFQSRGKLARLARLADRIDRQACEIDEEAREAIDDLRRHELRHARRHNHFVARPAYAFGGSPFTHVSHSRSLYQSRGISLSFGGGPSRVSLGAPVSRRISSRAFGAPPQLGTPHPEAWVRQAQAEALCRQLTRLRNQTRQLVRALNH